MIAREQQYLLSNQYFFNKTIFTYVKDYEKEIRSMET